MIRLEVDAATARRIVEALLLASGEAPEVAGWERRYRQRYRWVADDLGDALDALPPAGSDPLEP